MSTATITSKGQVTIPKVIREHLRLAEGDRVEFRVGKDGAVRLAPLSRSVRDLYAMLHRPGRKPATVEEMNEGIAAGRAEADRRTRSSRRKSA